MYKFLFFFGLILCIVSFVYFIFGLMNLKPLWVAAPLFYGSIFFTLHCYTLRHRGRSKENINGSLK